MAPRLHRRDFCLLAAALAAVPAAAPPAAADAETELSRAVKATYLYKLAPFVEWPAEAFPSPQAPLPICVLGDPAIAALLDRAVAGLQVDEHAFQIRQPGVIAPDSDCRMLYVGTPSGASIEQVLASVRGRPILTITDAAHGGSAKGVIHFVVHEGRVRFEIDERLARENGLRISSRVLELALRVRRASGIRTGQALA